MGKRKELIPFYVIIDDVNLKDFIKYDVMPYLVRCYDEKKKADKPVTFDEFKEFVKNSSMYMYWARCEYELVLKPWVGHKNEKKIDVHWQIMNNHDLVTSLLMLNVGAENNKLK